MESRYLDLIPKGYADGPAPRVEGPTWVLLRWAMDYDGAPFTGLHGKPIGEIYPSFKVARQIVNQQGQAFICTVLSAAPLNGDLLTVDLPDSLGCLYQVMVVDFQAKEIWAAPHLDVFIESGILVDPSALTAPPEDDQLIEPLTEFQGDYESAPLAWNW